MLSGVGVLFGLKLSQVSRAASRRARRCEHRQGKQMATENLISEEFHARLDRENEVRMAALVAAYEQAQLTKAERCGAIEARSALRAFETSKSRALMQRRKLLGARFGVTDLEYLARERGSHPLVREGVEAAFRSRGITTEQAAAYDRSVAAEKALEEADDGPLGIHAAALEEHFGTRDVFAASYDGLRYLRPGAI